MRYFLDISYNGTNYHGWQIQANAHTVQAELQNALSTILRSDIEITGSGRTDKGVHAKQQIVHFDTEELNIEEFLSKVNGLLPPDVSVNACQQVTYEAHARFDAIERAYIYYVQRKKSPFLTDQSYYYVHELDLDLMNRATKELIGEKDFQSFSKVKTEVNNFVCTLNHAEWIVENDQLVFHVSANRFLRGMVRALVGTLLDVGRHKLSVEDFVKVIEAKDRTKAGRAVPPQGLFLPKVSYRQEIYL